MSRSYQKTAGWTDKWRTKNFIKRYANKKVRKTKDIPNGKAFKKLYESYDICDYKFLFYSKKEVLENCKRIYTEKRIYRYYMK
jgi:hypothetical protein